MCIKMEYIEIIFLFYTKLVFIIFVVNGAELNQSEAISECADRGGLQSNNQFVKNNGFILLNSSHMASLKLQNGESAWILGYAEYMKFMSWHGCYKTVKHVVMYKFWNRNIVDCFHFCDKYKADNITYIGFRERFCYCIKTYDIRNNLEIIPDKECKQQKPYNIVFHNTKNSSAVSVFYLEHKPPIQYHDGNSVFQQCIFAKRLIDTCRYGAASCYTRSNDTAGFICTNSANGKLNTDCQKFFEADERSQAFCLQSQNVDWLSARERCTNFSGKLISHVIPTIQSEMKVEKKYWTGVFRNFNIVRNTSRVRQVPTACLAVTRIDNELVLDPDDCSSQKKYLCSDWSQYSVKTENIPVTSNSTEKNNTLPKWLYIVLAIALVGILASITCFAVRRFKRKSEHHILRENTPSSFNNEGDKPADITSANNEYSEAILPKSSQQIKSKRSLRKQDCSTPYENFKLKSEVSGYSAKFVRNVSEDYDKVDLKCGQLKVLDDHEQDENHIYDHTPTEEGSENYDTTRSIKFHQFDRATYNTLHIKCDNTSEKNKTFTDIENSKQFQDEAHDNNAYDTMGEPRTNEIETVFPTEAEAEQLFDFAN